MEPYSHANIILEELIICVSLHLMKNVLCNNAPNIFKEELVELHILHIRVSSYYFEELFLYLSLIITIAPRRTEKKFWVCCSYEKNN